MVKRGGPSFRKIASVGSRMFARTRRSVPSTQRRLGSAADFFTYNAAKCLLQGLLSALNMLAKSFIEQGLVVATASALDLVAEPCKDLVIDADGDTGFPSADGNHWAALGITEIVFTFHSVPHIDSSPASLRDALKSGE